MNIDRRITNGLAWAGVLLVVGVPTADLLSAQFLGNPAAPDQAQIAMIEPIVAPVPAPLSQRPAAPAAKPAAQVATVTPAKPTAAPVKPVVAPASQTADAVDAFLQSGRQMPSYITGADAPAQVAATTPTRPLITTTPVTQPAAVDPIEVASIPSQKVAPTPMPLSMRPEPVAVALVRDPVVIPPGLTPAEPTAIVRPPANVTAADLQDWETGPLADFLAQRQGGSAAVDADGFFLDEGPNRPRRDRIIARDVEPFFLFAD